MTENNYTVFHLHSDLSNGVTNVDSVTKYHEYIKKAKELGMKAMAFSEHGNIFEWYHKKKAIEEAGMKYIHAAEVYVTEQLEVTDENGEIKRLKDNYHCVLLAKNFDGFKELNKLISVSFNRSNAKTIDGEIHFYNRPRITFDELINTSDNIIITTACIAGILASGTNEIKVKFLEFLENNKHRCFLEIQHHIDDMQRHYNAYLDKISMKYGIPLIAGTDTHALNKEHAEGRMILQRGKSVHFDGEDNFDLTFKSYDELVQAYRNQCAIPISSCIKAIQNTNVMADMIEEYDIDKSIKYPKLYDNPVEIYSKKTIEGYKKNKYVQERYSQKEILDRIREEMDTYKKTKSIDFMLLQTYLREWEISNGIYCGYGRGSVSGSEIAYLLNITKMDSMKFGLNFFRFMNPSRVTNADIDTDYSAKDRERVKRFLLKDRMNLPQIRSSEIITFNTIALKGAIKDVGRAFGMSIELTQEISNSVMLENGKFTIDNKIRKQYPDLFRYVDIVNGTIVSVGTHPSGVLVSDRELSEEIGLCTLSSSDYPVSSLNMKELDELMFVKLDILGLDNLGVINDCCKLAGIERLTPDNTPLDDENVWKSIREDTTLIFQWESESASTYLRKFMSDETIEIAKKANKDFSYIKWLSFGNGLIRPACASFRYDVADGDITTTGFKELDEFLSVTFGRVAMQEDIMQFLVKFCGYSAAESDTVRRGIAKKSGTEALLPEIERRFIEYSSTNYKIGVDKCKEIIKPMLQVLLDASSYAFSWNHSDAYSCIGYICGYLRYYYPVEFITSALNTFKDNQEKSASIVEYANKVGVKINGISFGKSKAEYVMDKKTNSVYKGIESIKYCNANIAEELYELSQNNTYSSFVELLKDIKHKTSVNSRQLEILTVLNFFAEFGENKKLLDVIKLFDDLYERKQIKKQDIETLGIDMSIFELCFDTETEKMYKGLHMDKYVDIVSQRIENKPLSIKEQIKREQEYLEYIVYTNPKAPSNMFYVVETKFYKDKTKPYLQLYNLRTGEVLKTKITSGKKFVENPFQTGSVLHVKKFTEKNKMKNVNGEWVKTDDKEQILTEWDVY